MRLRRVAGPQYLFRADFDSAPNQAAPLTSPLPLDIGSLKIKDTGDKLSISAGQLVCTGGNEAAFGDPELATTLPFSRVPGRAFLLSLKPNQTNDYFMLGWGTVNTGINLYAEIEPTIVFNTAGDIVLGGVSGKEISSYTTAQIVLAIILRSTGVLILKGDATTSPMTLLYPWHSDSTTPLYPALTNLDAAFTLDNLRVLDLGGARASDYGIARTHVASPGAITPTFGGSLMDGDTLNGNMETDDPPTGWAAGSATLDGVADERDGGAGAQSINIALTGTAKGQAGRAATTVAGSWYELSGWLKKVTGGNPLIHFYLNADPWTAWGPTISGSLTSWQAVQKTTRVPATNSFVALQVPLGDAADNSNFDDIVLKPITLPSTLEA